MKWLLCILLLLSASPFRSAFAQTEQDVDPVTVVTKDNKQYYNVRYRIQEDGLLLFSPDAEGTVVVPYDLLSDDLSEFPRDVREDIKARQTPSQGSVQAAYDDSILRVTMKDGVTLQIQSFSLSKSGIVVQTHSGGNVVLAYERIELSTLPPALKSEIDKIIDRRAAMSTASTEPKAQTPRPPQGNAPDSTLSTTTGVLPDSTSPDTTSQASGSINPPSGPDTNSLSTTASSPASVAQPQSLDATQQQNPSLIINQINKSPPASSNILSKVIFCVFISIVILVFLAMQSAKSYFIREVFSWILIVSCWVLASFSCLFPSAPASPVDIDPSYTCNMNESVVHDYAIKALEYNGIRVRGSDTGMVWGTDTYWGIPGHNRITIFLNPTKNGCKFTLNGSNLFPNPFYSPQEKLQNVDVDLRELLREEAASEGDANSAYAAYRFYFSKERTYENRSNAANWLEKASALGMPVNDEMNAIQTDLWWLYFGEGIKSIIVLGFWFLVVMGIIAAFPVLLQVLHWIRLFTFAMDAFDGNFNKLTPTRTALTFIPFIRKLF